MQKFFAKAAQCFNRAAQFIANKLNDIRKIQPAKIIFKIVLALCVTAAAGLFIASLAAVCIATKLSSPKQTQNQQNQSTHELLPPQEQVDSPQYDLAGCYAQEFQLLDSQTLAALTQTLYPEQKQTWQSWITNQLILEEPTEATTLKAETDTILIRKVKSAISSELAITLACWQAIIQTTEHLNAIKASEMKKIAADLEIPKYRNMNKTQLLLEIISAHESAPEFSE
jgi:hypothetical protein